MGCSSSKPAHSSPPSARAVSQQHRPHEETIELQRSSSPFDLPPGPDTTLVPANTTQTVQSVSAPTPPQPDNTSQRPPPGSGRSNFTPVPRSVSRTASVSPLHLGGWQVSEETSRKPEFDRPNRSLSPHHMSRSFSADTSRNRVTNDFQPLVVPSSSTGGGHSDGGGNGTSHVGPRADKKRAATRDTGPLLPTVQEMLPPGFRFRILVLGKRQSGKSSLISAVFNVDMAAAPGSQHGNADINNSFKPDNNRYLAVHEYSGFESGDAETAIRDFISSYTDAKCPVLKRLHAIWICVPISDPIERVEGIKNILGMKKVPVLIVFTKFDLLVSNFTRDRHENPRARAHAMYEDLCRSQFNKDPKDVPAVIFSAEQESINELTSTTHRFIKTESLKSTSRRASSQQPSPPVDPFLAWSVAQRVMYDYIIKASIEVGRSRYWRNLGHSQDFTNRTLESCVNVIHEDIVSVWNFDDRESYLVGGEFTAMMTGLVRDMARSDVSSTNNPNSFLNDSYQNNHRNIRYIMAYIIDLTVILHRLFLSTRRVSATKVQSAVRDYAKGSSRSQIHEEIQNFVKVAQNQLFYQNKDMMMEKIIDLITQNCTPN